MTTDREGSPDVPEPAPSPVRLADDRAWGARDAAYYLNVSEALVRKLEQLGRLPALPRIGRRLNFDPQVVKQFRENPKKFTPRSR